MAARSHLQQLKKFRFTQFLRHWPARRHADADLRRGESHKRSTELGAGISIIGCSYL